MRIAVLGAGRVKPRTRVDGVNLFSKAYRSSWALPPRTHAIADGDPHLNFSLAERTAQPSARELASGQRRRQPRR